MLVAFNRSFSMNLFLLSPENYYLSLFVIGIVI